MDEEWFRELDNIRAYEDNKSQCAACGCCIDEESDAHWDSGHDCYICSDCADKYL